MKYFTLHIDDSGAIEDFEEKIVDVKKTLICDMYDDPECNSMNDMLHSIYDYIMNEKTLSLFRQNNIIPYDVIPVQVRRKEKRFSFLSHKKIYPYYRLSIREPKDLHCYEWINFNESDIVVLKNDEYVEKLLSHTDLLKYIEENKQISSMVNEIYSQNISEKEKMKHYENLRGFSFVSKTIVFNKNFDNSIDLFKIPFYSSGTYISERFRGTLERNNITGIRFAESKEDIGKVWQPNFPEIQFE